VKIIVIDIALDRYERKEAIRRVDYDGRKERKYRKLYGIKNRCGVK